MYSVEKDCFDDEEFYNIIFNTTTDYWLSSREVSLWSNDGSYCCFAIRAIRLQKLGGQTMGTSWNANHPGVVDVKYSLRPIINIKKEFGIKKDKINEDGTITWNIYKNK